MTGAREVMAEAALGLLSRNVWRGFMKPAMFVRDARAHRRETGNIYRKVGLKMVNKRWDRGKRRE